MAWPPPQAWRKWLPLMAWMVLLASLPWWLGLPLLLALALVLLMLQHRLVAEHASSIRRALRWGLPGVLFALQRALGGDAFAWGAALLGVLVGYTLLAGLEAWLDRDLRRAPANGTQAEWPELAMAPIGPPADIIALELPAWQLMNDLPIDAYTERLDYRDGECRIGDEVHIVDASPHVCIEPNGAWLVVRMSADRGIVLLHRPDHRLHRLRGWKLAGWHGGQPWLMRREGDMPVALATLLRRDRR
jgi:hypothetical protein